MGLDWVTQNGPMDNSDLNRIAIPHEHCVRRSHLLCREPQVDKPLKSVRRQAYGYLRSTQPCIPPGSLNRVPASTGVRAGMSPLPGGR